LKPASSGGQAGKKAWRKFRALPGAVQAGAGVALVVILGAMAALGGSSDNATSVAQSSSKTTATPVATPAKAATDPNCVAAFKEAGSYDVFGKARDIVRDIGDGKANLGDYSQLKAYAAKAEQIGKSKVGKACADPELSTILDNGITATVTMSKLAVYASHDQIDQFSAVLRKADLKADAAFYDLL
jgi:hypothetical protein